MSFVRSGYVRLVNGQTKYVGELGYSWSHVAQSATYAYYLYMGPTDVLPSGSYDRWFGLHLRRLYYGSV